MCGWVGGGVLIEEKNEGSGGTSPVSELLEDRVRGMVLWQ